MNFRVLYKGSDIKDDVLSYTREHNLCNSMSTLTLMTTLKSHNFLPYETITIEEDGVAKGKFYIASIEDSVPGSSTVLACQDATKRLADYFIPELTSSGEAPSYTRYWIEKYLSEAGVSYTFDVSGSGTLVNNNSSFGMDSALSTVTTLLMQSGWYMHTDGNDTIHIGKVTIDMSNVAAEYDNHDIITIKTNLNDGMLRNKVIVWGAGNAASQDYVFAHMDTITPWNRDSNDYRTVLISVPTVRDNITAAGIAGQVLSEMEQITYIKQVVLTGFRNVGIGDTVFIDSDWFLGAGIITGVSCNVTNQAATTTITLDERCPKIIGYYDYGDYVYVGTHGGGIWRKHLNYDHTWYNYSTGLVNLDVIDLSIYNGMLACVTKDGKLYTRKSSESSWVQFSATGRFLDENGGAHGTNDTTCVACVVSTLDNHILALFNLNGQVTEGWSAGLPYYQVVGNPRSWLVDFTNRSIYKADVIRAVDYNVYTFDIDHDGNRPYISALYRAGDINGMLDWDDPNPRFTRYASVNTIPVGSTGETPAGGWWSDQYKGHGFGSHNKQNYGGYMGGNTAFMEMEGLYYMPSIKAETYRGALSEHILACCALFSSTIEFVDFWGIYLQDFTVHPAVSVNTTTIDNTTPPFSTPWGVGSSIGASFFIEKLNYSQKHRAVMLRVWDYTKLIDGTTWHRFGVTQDTIIEGETTIISKTISLGSVVDEAYSIAGISRLNVETEFGFCGWYSDINGSTHRFTYSNDSFSSASATLTENSNRPYYSKASKRFYFGSNVGNGCEISDDSGNIYFSSTTENLKQISTSAMADVAWVQQTAVPKNNRIVGLCNSTGRNILPSGVGFSLGRNGDDLTGDYIAKANFGDGAKLYRFNKDFMLVPSGSLYSTSSFDYPSVYENCVMYNDDFNRDRYDYNEEESSGAASFPVGGNKGSGATGWYPYGVLRPTPTGGFDSVFLSAFRPSIDTSKGSPVVVWGDGAAHGWMNLSDSGDVGTYKDVYPSGWFMSAFLRNGPRCYDTITYSGGTGNSYRYRRVLYPVGNTVYNYSINNHTTLSGTPSPFGTLDSEEGMYHAFPYEATTVEATNIQQVPYLFVGTSGTTPHFYQRDSDVIGTNPLWTERTTGLPANHISIIRVDDRI
jgi:hypothetical protein